MFSIEERMGPRWSEAEILIFLEGLRRHGKDWTAISQDFKDSNAETVHSRTEQMIEAAYQKNKTYLSRSSANPTDFYAIMADHYESYEGVKQNDPKLNSPVNDNLEIPKRRSERPYELRPVVKRPSPRKFESYDIISRQADYSIINNKKLIEAYSKRSFVDFVYSPSIFLTEYAMNKGEEQPISPKFLQWCKAEWFYSYIDKAFFDHNEFEEALKVLKISEIENFSKYEYSLIRNILGRPRRFSSSFISQERKKLSKYREAIKVLQQGKILPSSHHDMLGYIKKNPNSSSRLMVGQRVLSIHPGCKELRSGNILTLDSSRYHIQFDRPDLGVTSVTDTQILPLFSDAKKIPDSEEGSSFVYKPIQEREVISINSAIEGFKAGVNVYAMAFLLKLLERKEALIELLKQYNAEFALKVHDNPQWRPDNDLQQQYAWICVTVQAINTSISKVLEIFRLRNRPPPQPALKIEPDNKIDQIKEAASSLVLEELDQRSGQFSETEFNRIQESLKNGVVLLGVLDLIIKENDLSLVKHLEESLNLMSPACESNKPKYEEVCKSVEQIKNKLTTR